MRFEQIIGAEGGPINSLEAKTPDSPIHLGEAGELTSVTSGNAAAFDEIGKEASAPPFWSLLQLNNY